MHDKELVMVRQGVCTVHYLISDELVRHDVCALISYLSVE